MRTALVFTALVACSGGTSPTARTPPREPVSSDSTRGQVAPASPRLRGAACTPAQPCAEDLSCAPLAGGYCTSACGVTGLACDGSCVATPRGELCLAACTRDADCRVDEGYVCDPTWRACLLPNLPVIVPAVCPALGIGRAAAFGPTTRLATAALPGVYHHEPSSVLGNAGGIVALFTTRSGPVAPSGLGIARLDGRGAATIDVAVAFAATAPSPAAPRLARDGTGTIYAAWLGGTAGAQEIGLATSKDQGVTWSPVRAVHEPTDCAPERACLDRPLIAVGPHPARRFEEVVYVLYEAAGLRVRASLDRGATFRPAVTALAGSYGNAVVGGDGRLHVVTLNGGPGGAYGAADHAIEYAVSSDAGATFGTPIRVSVRDEMLPFYFANPSLAVDDRRGYLYVAYTRGGRDAKWDLVIAASRDRGKTWKRTRLGDTPACAIHLVPNLALDPVTGSLHVAWYDSRARAPSVGRFAHAVCKPGAAACVQRGAINDVPFAALSTARHASTWIGDSQSLVVDAKRRKLHAVWAQPVDENGTIVTRIFHAAAKL